MSKKNKTGFKCSTVESEYKRNSNLTRAKKAKNDEFYTQIGDIEEELQHYDLMGKSVFVNCDDPRKSNFWKYFSDNFNTLGITKLVSCHYAKEGGAFSMEKTSQKEEAVRTNLTGDGSFDSPESKALLKECDVVITNPPFSKFRAFIQILFDSEKEFLIIGNINAISYKNVLPHIIGGSLWLGVNNRPYEFEVPSELADPTKQGARITEDGRYMQTVLVRWITNMVANSHKPFMELTKTYYGNEHEYPQYANYDAINVDRIKNIPKDYAGIIGVPISFLDKWNPDQFEVVGFLGNPYIGERSIFKRFLIRRINSEKVL